MSKTLTTAAEFGTKGEETAASKAQYRTAACYWCALSRSGEALRPFSGSSVSMTPHSAAAAASEAGDSPPLLWAGGEIRRGVEGAGRAQSHWGAGGSSQGRCRCVAAEREGAGEEVRGTLPAVQSVTPAALKEGWPGSVFRVWGEPMVLILSKETR